MKKRTLLRNNGRPYVLYASWFPDSAKVAYETESVGVRSIQINGQEDAPLPLYEAAPIWSADGTKVAFRASTWKAYHWYPRIDVVLTLSERTYTVFSGEPDSYISDPSWSPDGKHVAFAFGLKVPEPSPSLAGYRPAIYIADAVTGGLARLTRDDYRYSWAQYAPKGNLIALAREKSSYSDVVVLRDLASSCEVTLPFDDVWGASWSPDGRRLVITADRTAYIVDLDKFLGPKFATTGSICP